MTFTHAYIEFEDKQVELPNLPHGTRVLNYWNLIIEDWCKKHSLPYQQVDPYWVTTQVNKNQIENFIMENFGHTHKRDGRGVSWWEHDLHKKLEELRWFLCSELSEGNQAIMGGYEL